MHHQEVTIFPLAATADRESSEILASMQTPKILRHYFIGEDGRASSPARLRPEETEQQQQRSYTTDLVEIHGTTSTIGHLPNLWHTAENDTTKT
jgi:hypothetical protein